MPRPAPSSLPCPADDPLATVVVDGAGDVVDGQGNPVLFSWPAGTKVTVKAEPLSHPAGFKHILLAWVTSPGTAINQCPTPEEEHTFTVPPLDTGQTLSISLVARVTDTGASVTTFPYDEDWLSSAYKPTRAFCEPYAGIGVLGDAYTLLGPVGAAARFRASFHNPLGTIDFDGTFESPLGAASWGQFTAVSDNDILYYPWHKSPNIDPPVTRNVPLVVNGDRGDLELTLNGVFWDGPAVSLDGQNPSAYHSAANLALTPGAGNMPSTEETPITYIVPQFDVYGLSEEVKAHLVPTTHLFTDTEVVDTDPAKSAGTAKNEKGGFIYGEHRYSYDPGDPNIVSTMYPAGRDPETKTLNAAIIPGYALLCWSIDGTDIYDETNLPENVTYSSSSPFEITIAMTKNTEVILKLVAVEFCLTFDDGPFGYANPEDDKNDVIPTTRNVLDCLARHSIEATFFVQTHRNVEPHGGGSLNGVILMQRALNEGHTIGVHVGGDLCHVYDPHTALVTRAGIEVGLDGEWEEGTIPTATIGGNQANNALISSMIAGKRRLQSVLDYNTRFVRPPGLKENADVYSVYGAPEVNLYNSSDKEIGSDMAFYINVDPVDWEDSPNVHNNTKERLSTLLASCVFQ